MFHTAVHPTNPDSRSVMQLISLRMLAVLAFAVFLTGDPVVSHAQQFQFGKNRVQYDQFDWRYIQSDHFDIYYYDSDNYYLAEFTAHSLETAYVQLVEDFNHEINDRIPVIIYDSHVDFSQTNVVPLPVDARGIGGVTDRWKNRITMPFMGDYGDFRQVLQHELVHAVFNDMFYGGTITSAMQSNVQLQIPLWFEEGLAEYVSQGWDTDTDMFMRDVVTNNALPPIRQLGGFFAYRGGQALWDYIVREYGREKIGEILQNVRRMRSVPAAMREALGVTLEELSREWHNDMQRRYWPEFAERESITEVGRLVTRREFGGAFNVSPTISPQGDRIAMITNRRGYLDVIVVDAATGRKIKTLVRGDRDVDLEELNILEPNLAWSPDGEKLAFSTRAEGNETLAIVDYRTGDAERIDFPQIDAVKSVNWSPDGEKIAFHGNAGPYTDIYIYNVETEDFMSVTNDVFSDRDPSWTADSEGLLFASNRGSRTELNTFKTSYNVLLNPTLNTTDIYKVALGDDRAERLTHGPNWNDKRPLMIREGEHAGRIVFVSDRNGIPNVYELDTDSRESFPLTDLVIGVQQMSMTIDGRRIALNSYNGGATDIFTLNNPLQQRREGPLSDNRWAERRRSEPLSQRVPAFGYINEMMDRSPLDIGLLDRSSSVLMTQQQQIDRELAAHREEQRAQERREEQEARQDEGRVDFRDYTFSEAYEEESEERAAETFSPQNNRTEDGRFIPRDYRLSFSPDVTFAGGQIATGYGAFAYTQLEFSDLLGDHRISVASNLVFDLRNSDYTLNYGYFRNRTNYIVNYFHTSRNFQTLGFGPTGEPTVQLVRFRTYGGGLSLQYPINKFSRIDYGVSLINISRDFSDIQFAFRDTERAHFLYPQATYVRDMTQAGFLTPQRGARYAIGIQGSPPITRETLRFGSITGDYRRYFNLGLPQTTFALRASGGFSFGRNSQTFFLGGMQNWINFAWAEGQIPQERLEDIFFTMPVTPLRGYEFNASHGDRYGLVNAEFRFPLVAAILPGPIPILPLYNIQGTAFADIGTTWQGVDHQDMLVGAGFGLRTIALGMPFRYDMGWSYDRENGGRSFGEPIHYFSIGIDF